MRGIFVVMLALAGCGSGKDNNQTSGGPGDCKPGEMALDNGGCQPAGLPPDMPCPPGQAQIDGGSCQPAGVPSDTPEPGVPPSACGQGFEPDGNGGCNPILPVDPCPAGQVAVPGDTSCHDIAPCGNGTWGSIPVEANTQFVDQAYQGGSSDGSQQHPWTTIGQGMTAAAPGAIVAVAAGSYMEDLMIKGKAARLWGRCPAMVEVAGVGAHVAAIVVLQSLAAGSEIHDLAVTGPTDGIGVSGATGVEIDGVWIHDTGSSGFDVQNDLGATSATMKGSLIEQCRQNGMLVAGAKTTLETTVVRSTLPNASGAARGIEIDENGMRADVTVQGCVVEQSHGPGIVVVGADATVEDTVVRASAADTQVEDGRGISIEDHTTTKARANVTLRGCLVDKNQTHGVAVLGSDATIENTVVRSTLADAQGVDGQGIILSDDTSTKQIANATIRTSLIEQNQAGGVAVSGSNATIEGTVIHASGGRGIAAQNDAQARGALTIRACRVEGNHGEGVFVSGSDATIESTKVLLTQHDAMGKHGRGIGVQIDPQTMERSNLILRASSVEQNQELGVLVAGSDATIEATVAGANADYGFDIQGDPTTKARANVTIHGSLVEQNHQVGLFVAGSDATIEASVVRSTLPDAMGHAYGVSIESGIALANPEPNERANVTIRACLLEQHSYGAVFVAGSDATIETSEIGSDPDGTGGQRGRGVNIQIGLATEPSKVTIRACLVEQAADVGLYVSQSDATIQDSIVHGTALDPEDSMGDGITAIESDVTVQNVEVDHNARAGVLFDVSTGTLSGVMSTNNQYGLVLQGQKSPDYQSGDNQFSGNTKQDIYLQGDLALPDDASPVPESP